MSLENPSYSAAERLIYGPPAKISISEASDNVSGAVMKVGPYRRHSYQVSGSDGADPGAVFRVYGSNCPLQAQEDYQEIAIYSVNYSGVMYSDEWIFDSAYAAITDHNDGTFTVIEKHSP